MFQNIANYCKNDQRLDVYHLNFNMLDETAKHSGINLKQSCLVLAFSLIYLTAGMYSTSMHAGAHLDQSQNVFIDQFAQGGENYFFIYNHLSLIFNYISYNNYNDICLS